jgi:hypothetical protein
VLNNVCYTIHTWQLLLSLILLILLWRASLSEEKESIPDLYTVVSWASTHSRISVHVPYFKEVNVVASIQTYNVISGAYEPPKAAKEHVTRESSKYKSTRGNKRGNTCMSMASPIDAQFPNMESF